MNIELEGASFKACHLLPGKKQLPYGLLPAVIVEFVYFEERKSGIQSKETPQEEKSSDWKKFLYQ